jgi:uncharacterized protein (DUF2147 family)
MPLAPTGRFQSLLALMLGVVLWAGLPLWAADIASPLGEWRTVDDATGKPRAVVRIVQQDGALFGVVEKSLVPNPTHRTCDDCTDDRRGKPIVGMEIIRGLHRDGESWSGGTILDPEHGKVYRCTLELRDGGRHLAVRGYIGVALFGRTQVWERVE